MRRVEIDWAGISSVDQLWQEIVTKSGHPAWHGRNLDALNDGWVNGGLDDNGPPYEFIFLNCERVPDALRELATAVMDTADESVTENGGVLRRD